MDDSTNVLDTVRRDAVREARTGTTETPLGGAGGGGNRGAVVPTTFALGTGSLRAFKLDSDTLETAANSASQNTYLF